MWGREEVSTGLGWTQLDCGPVWEPGHHLSNATSLGCGAGFTRETLRARGWLEARSLAQAAGGGLCLVPGTPPTPAF